MQLNSHAHVNQVGLESFAKMEVINATEKFVRTRVFWTAIVIAIVRVESLVTTVK